ncbi:biotin/lipoyl-containing protein, partial [Sphingobium sp. ba1]|uniref:biotin/lipoyl-containing protein n=1 Tax=Sphingobium sp. ba1 TaxID=1522072 RepID=UPI00055F4D22
MATEVKVPTLGESVTEATVGQWLKKPGEAVALDEPIVSLETDKVAVDVPSPVAGTLGDIVAKEGDTVNVGALLAMVNEGAAAAAAPAASPAPAAKAEAAAPAPAASAPAPAASDEEEGGNLTLSPAVRRLVLEHGLDPSKIKGTGKDGRLTKDDVTAAVAAGTAKAAASTPASAPAA